jgi:hypothetical protein
MIAYGAAKCFHGLLILSKSGFVTEQCSRNCCDKLSIPERHYSLQYIKMNKSDHQKLNFQKPAKAYDLDLFDDGSQFLSAPHNKCGENYMPTPTTDLKHVERRLYKFEGLVF